MFKELDCISLKTDLPEYGLKKSAVGTIVHVYPDGEVFIVEFLDQDGNTIAVTDVLQSQARVVLAGISEEITSVAGVVVLIAEEPDP